MNRDRAVTIEVCVTSLAGARTAAAAGAHRLELCSGLPLGGLTPSFGLTQTVLAAVDLPVIALIRPREGGFRYHEDEIVTQIADVAAFAEVGVAGFAVGGLTAGGDLDGPFLTRLRETAPDVEWCLHRAFDHVRDADLALETAIELGFDRVLTSGLAASAPAGAAQIASLVARSAGRIEVMPGGGITAENAVSHITDTGVGALHLSASRWVPGGMDFSREGIPLGAGAAPDEARHLDIDGDRLESLFRALAAR